MHAPAQTARAIIGAILALLTVAATRVTGNTAAIPAPRDPTAVPPDPHWMERHQQFVAQAKQGGIELLFIGDSITDFWRRDDPQQGGKRVWQRYYGSLHAANFGIGADRTQHVLWRLQHGEVDGLNPKVVVLLIGTNNVGFERDRPAIRRNTTAEAIEGITTVVDCLRTKLPQTKIMLLALFPRGERNDPIREQIREVNRSLARLDDHKSVFFVDVGSRFLLADGSIATELMPDLLHPSEKGYAAWADAMQGPLATLLR